MYRYMQERPDARSYRVKTVPSYHKLCVIYGQENFDERYSRLAFNLDSAGEIPVLMTGIFLYSHDKFIQFFSLLAKKLYLK